MDSNKSQNVIMSFYDIFNIENQGIDFNRRLIYRKRSDTCTQFPTERFQKDFKHLLSGVPWLEILPFSSNFIFYFWTFGFCWLWIPRTIRRESKHDLMYVHACTTTRTKRLSRICSSRVSSAFLEGMFCADKVCLISLMRWMSEQIIPGTRISQRKKVKVARKREREKNPVVRNWIQILCPICSKQFNFTRSTYKWISSGGGGSYWLLRSESDKLDAESCPHFWAKVVCDVDALVNFLLKWFGCVQSLIIISRADHSSSLAGGVRSSGCTAHGRNQTNFYFRAYPVVVQPLEEETMARRRRFIQVHPMHTEQPG